MCLLSILMHFVYLSVPQDFNYSWQSCTPEEKTAPRLKNWYATTDTTENNLKNWPDLDKHCGKTWKMCRDSRALSSYPRDRSLEGSYLLGTRMADQGDEGLRLCGHGTLIDEYLLDIEVLQGVGRRGGARAQDDIVALQFVFTSFCQVTFVADGQ